MSDVEKAAIEQKLNELSDRLQTPMADFRKSGSFSDVDQTLLNGIQ